jgi:hypothetical protein
MLSRVGLDRPGGGRSEFDGADHLLDTLPGETGRAGQHAQVIAPGPAGVKVVRLKYGADVTDRLVELA